MKRAGFTMIELIFVIVILGILAAVALPKFIGVSEQAQLGKIKAFVGTMNRTAGPAMWSKSIGDGNNGEVNGTDPSTYVDIPSVFTTTTTSLTCDGSTAEFATTAASAGSVYKVKCINGDIQKSPQFFLTDGSDNNISIN